MKPILEMREKELTEKPTHRLLAMFKALREKLRWIPEDEYELREIMEDQKALIKSILDTRPNVETKRKKRNPRREE